MGQPVGEDSHEAAERILSRKGQLQDEPANPGMVQKRGLTSEPTLDYDPENGFRRGACPRF